MRFLGKIYLRAGKWPNSIINITERLSVRYPDFGPFSCQMNPAATGRFVQEPTIQPFAIPVAIVGIMEQSISNLFTATG
jgi:hypothetical protein